MERDPSAGADAGPVSGLMAGPMAGAAWTAAPGGIVVLPDAANAQRAAAGLAALYHGLPAAPQLARHADGKPVFSLSLVLRRRPQPDDDSVYALIDAAALACDISLALPPTAPQGVRPLFARDAELVLERVADGSALAQVRASGAGWRAGLAGRLGRADAQAVLAALDGRESGLVLRCRIGYRAAGMRERLRLSIRWRDVHDWLGDRLDADGGIDAAALRELLPGLVESGALRAWRIDGGTEQALAPQQGQDLWPAFGKLCAVVLERVTPALSASDLQARFTLRAGPVAPGEMNTQWTLDSARDERTELQAPLEDVLGGVLAGQEAEAFIHLACPDPGAPDGYAAAPRRLRVSPPRSRAPAPGAASGMTAATLTPVDGRLVSMTRALQPDRAKAPPLSAVLASDTVQFHAAAPHTFAIHAIELSENGPPQLPRLGDPNAPVWVDHSDQTRFWYAPEFALVPPDPAAPAAGAPFLFTFRQAGHDAAGQPALEGEVRFTLQRKMSAASAAALAERANPAAFPVPATGSAVSLDVPVRDESGQLRRVVLAADVSAAADGTLVATVPLLAAYVRATYGALALAGFQSEPARLHIAYSFDAMVLTHIAMTLAYGKQARIPVVYTAQQQEQLHTQEAGRGYMDARNLVYRGPDSDVRFKREAAAPEERPAAMAMAATAPAEMALAEGAAGEAAAVAGMSRAAAGGMPAAASPAAQQQTAAPPALPAGTARIAGAVSTIRIPSYPANDAVIQQAMAKWHYVRQTQGRRMDLDVFFPCSTLGALYCQQQDDTLTAIGCREAFSLGQVPLALFEPVDAAALAGLPCKVLRSLTQPGRFVLLPSTYLITHFAPGEGERAYRPAIYLYSTLDPDHPETDRCVLMASLQPDLSQDQRRRIDAVLQGLHPAPVLDLINAIDCAVKHSDWLAGMAPDVERSWDGFQVTLATDPAGALMLQEMLKHGGANASLTFTLPDGAELTSTLVLDLNRLTGPWDGGPLQLAQDGANAVLTNRIEGPVDLSDLAALDAGGAATLVPAERRLAPGEAVTIPLPAGSKPGWPVYTIPPGDAATLEEIRSFVENIETNVLFINVINYANHQLRRLDLRARLKEVPGSERAVTMNDEQTMGEAAFTLPLTVYQGPRTLEFQVSMTGLAGAVTTKGWFQADLRAGNAVTLNWDLLK